MEYRAYVPARKPSTQFIKKLPVKKVAAAKTKEEKDILLRKRFMVTHKKEAYLFEKITNIHPFMILKACQQNKWALDLAVQHLDNPDKIHTKWFFFYINTCYLAGEEYIQSKITAGQKLYDIVKEFGALPSDEKEKIAAGRKVEDVAVKLNKKLRPVTVKKEKKSGNNKNTRN